MNILLNHFVLKFQLGCQLCVHLTNFGQIRSTRFPAQVCSSSLFVVKYEHVNYPFAISENVSQSAILKSYFL